jgi:hypothetical protein
MVVGHALLGNEHLLTAVDDEVAALHAQSNRPVASMSFESVSDSTKKHPP